eukprot:TRINITY_DN16057_c0_g1_i1.p1 TRINITY_DN16057_c0_g1~~TRINITY_DN16057_c0_g1_i1.p1  ORF type:complete len:111 (-),score=15.05 TRINITY_DN16057_c0_g1_i1:85-417(-)
MVLLFIEMSIVNHKTMSLTTSLGDSTLLGLAYLGWSYLTFTQNGMWPYPFQATFGLTEHVLFDSGALVLLWMTGLSVRQLNATVNPSGNVASVSPAAVVDPVDDTGGKDE